mgnify:CR=1 FL=1
MWYTDCMPDWEHHNKFGVPEAFRSLLWSFKFDAIDPERSKEDIIVNTLNDGTLKHWHWIIERYGREAIWHVLAKRLTTEFYPESLNLALLVFDLPRGRMAAMRRVSPLRYA